MRFADLPPGTLINLGDRGYGGYKFQWRVKGDGFALAETSVSHNKYCGYDHYDNYYPQSRIHQWLHDTEGFLRLFNAEERDCLQMFEIDCAIPKRHRINKQAVERISVLAALPSVSEVMAIANMPSNAPHEGSKLDLDIRYELPTRTPCGERSYYRASAYHHSHAPATQYQHLYPMIRIKPDTNFELNHNGAGFIIAAPIEQLDTILLW